jgi:hypothetical protein
VATAASAAVPPSSSTRAPISEAMRFCEATIPRFASTGSELALSETQAVTMTPTIDQERRVGLMRGS